MLSAYDSAFRGEVVELVEGAALEMLYTLIAYRGFESLPLLQYIAGLCKGSTADSDSVCLGSNPSSAAKNRQGSTESCRFYLLPIHSSLFPKMPCRFLESNK